MFFSEDQEAWSIKFSFPQSDERSSDPRTQESVSSRPTVVALVNVTPILILQLTTIVCSDVARIFKKGGGSRLNWHTRWSGGISPRKWGEGGPRVHLRKYLDFLLENRNFYTFFNWKTKFW